MDKALNQPHSVDPRENPRTNIFVGAVIRDRGLSLPVKVRNISVAGALVEGTALPAEGAEVELARGSLAVPAAVAWCAEGRCGLRFSTLACVSDWLAPSANPGQQRVDEAVRVLKLGAVPLPQRPASETDPPFRGQLVQLSGDLRSAMRLVKDLCHELSSESDVVTRHAEKLQNMDIVQQTVATVADSLERGVDENAMTRLGSLRASCGAALQKLQPPS